MKYGQLTKILTVTLVSGDCPNLLGRNWLDALKLGVVQIAKVECATQLDALLRQYTELFKDELGILQNFQASLQLKEGVTLKKF